MSRPEQDSLRDIFIHETKHNLDCLEQAVLQSERNGTLSKETIDEIFRIMHTIKGSSLMMRYECISSYAHAAEDLFSFLRQNYPIHTDYSAIYDLILSGVDYLQAQISSLVQSNQCCGNPKQLIDDTCAVLSSISPFSCEDHQAPPHKAIHLFNDNDPNESANYQEYDVIIYFDIGCQLEAVRAFAILHELKSFAQIVHCIPENVESDDDTNNILIQKNGFHITFRSDRSMNDLRAFFNGILLVKSVDITAYESVNTKINSDDISLPLPEDTGSSVAVSQPASDIKVARHSYISVDVEKLDAMMDIMGEIYISLSMVTHHPDISQLYSDSFSKATSLLSKNINEMQDMVMSVRMVPLVATFQRITRIVRDINHKLHKQTDLTLIGEYTEVDKNIIEHVSDPLMHLVRNAVDHGIEDSIEERRALGKPDAGRITLEARHADGTVIITVRDDGRGFDKNKILAKAKKLRIIQQEDHEISEQDILNLILSPGFSTHDNVTEYSGRGIGLDIVSKSIKALGGFISIESTPGQGAAISLNIPLTLAIIDGMNIRVGSMNFIVPTSSIREVFHAAKPNIINDTQGNELLLVRNTLHSILRLHQEFHLQTPVQNLTEGVMLMISQENANVCLFVDELIGRQQVVVKSLPSFFKHNLPANSFSGCTLLADGSICLILNISELLSRFTPHAKGGISRDTA